MPISALVGKRDIMKMFEPPDSVFYSGTFFGDTLSMARFVREACGRARYVHACVHPELLRLFQYAFIDIPNLNLMPQPCSFPAADAWTTFVSLPFALGLSDDAIRNMPQIKFDAPRTNAKQWKVPDRKFHIGIAWAGSPLNDIDKHRCVPVTQFLELYRVPGIQLYSLQMDNKKHELFSTGCAPVIRDLSGIPTRVDSISSSILQARHDV
jgi:hypothetical protein